MTFEILTALCIFAFVTSVTPGPNNLMLMTSGANFGVWRTVPHFMGVVFGFMLMMILMGTSLIQVFDAYPVSFDVLRVCSIGYLGYLAWKIAGAKPGSVDSRARPLTALQAALFQWVNPKAWAMAITAVTVYAPSQNLFAIGLVTLICGLINMPSVFVWVLLGSRVQRYLGSEFRLKMFNYSMALLLLATLYPAVVEMLQT